MVSVDNSYGEDGIVTTDFGASREEIRTITIQEDGKNSYWCKCKS